MNAKTKICRLVLVGGGHAHVQVVKALNHYSRPKNLHVTLIDINSEACYSGMIPGCVSKLYKQEETKIHLSPLAKWAHIDFLQREVIDIDPTRNVLFLKDDDEKNIISSKTESNSALDGSNCFSDYADNTVCYDVVSFDIGSTSRGLQHVVFADDDEKHWRDFVIPTRPISELVQRIEDAEKHIIIQKKQQQRENNNNPVVIDVVVVGGGAAGIELSLAMMARWGSLTNELSVTILDGGRELLPNENSKCREAMKNALKKRNVNVKHRSTVQTVKRNEVILQNGDVVPFTHCLWATGASPHSISSEVMRRRGIAISDDGWIRVKPTLQSISHGNIFAAGDCATIEGLYGDKQSPPKAGVYAVRTGPILIENLTRCLGQFDGEPSWSNSSSSKFATDESKLLRYDPQDDFLKLIMCGDGTALGFRFGLPLEGRWVWQLKDNIDRMFMNLFAEENLPAMEEGAPLDTSQYDTADDHSDLLDPVKARALLFRTDEDVDFKVAEKVLRCMRDDPSYRSRVLQVNA